MIYENQDQLNTALELWKIRLRLQHWHITARIKRIFDMPDGCRGRFIATWLHPSAVIDILDPNDYDPAYTEGHDMEEVLVHELVHLHVNRVSKAYGGEMDDEKEIVIDNAVRALSKALVEAYRKGLTA
jgi:hypothetical protein